MDSLLEGAPLILGVHRSGSRPAQPTDPLALLDVNQSRLTRSRVEAPSEVDTKTFENEMGAAIAAAQTEAS